MARGCGSQARPDPNNSQCSGTATTTWQRVCCSLSDARIRHVQLVCRARRPGPTAAPRVRGQVRGAGGAHLGEALRGRAARHALAHAPLLPLGQAVAGAPHGRRRRRFLPRGASLGRRVSRRFGGPHAGDGPRRPSARRRPRLPLRHAAGWGLALRSTPAAAARRGRAVRAGAGAGGCGCPLSWPPAAAACAGRALGVAAGAAARRALAGLQLALQSRLQRLCTRLCLLAAAGSAFRLSSLATVRSRSRQLHCAAAAKVVWLRPARCRCLAGGARCPHCAPRLDALPLHKQQTGVGPA